MGCAEESSNLFMSNLAVNKKSKGNLFTEKPVFCENGNSIIIASGPSCHLYNTSTGNHVKELFQCENDIITCQLHPLQSNLVIAVTENGEVTVFNLKTKEIEFSIQLILNGKTLTKQNLPKFSDEVNGEENFDWTTQQLDSLSQRRFLYAEVKPFHGNSSEIYVWASWSLSDEVQSHVSIFSLRDGKLIKNIGFKRVALRKSYLNFVLGSCQGLDVFVGMSSNFVHVIYFEKKSNFYSFKKHFIGQNIKVSCLAFHPTECSFATGDSLGRIIIWRNIFEKHPLKDLLHWHTLPVRDLAFSKFGNYLFSGGEENVLVKWSLSSRSKEFLPRLSSAIHHLSVYSESSFISVSTIDNRVLIINFNFQSVSTIQHYSRWSVLKGDYKHKIFTIDPRSNCFVLNGKTGHIQFLSQEEEGRFMFTFDVTNRNFITSDSNCTIENTEVTHARFTKCGKWLITAESRKEGVFKESRLKFWQYCDKEGTFSLNTNVEQPHEEAGIHSVEISSDDRVATTGPDKKFRLWEIFECQQVNRIKEIWSVQNVGKYRNLPCFAVDFSKDASLIAVSFASLLTIWETDSCVLKCTLSVPYRKDELKFCKFGNNELSHLVVTGSESNVSCWNTITLSMIWTVPLRLAMLIGDPFSNHMCAFSADNSLIVFNPSSPSAEFILKNVSDSPVVAAHSTFSDAGRFCLYFLTSRQDLFCVEDSEKIETTVSTNSTNATFLTPYSAQLPQIQNRVESAAKRKNLVSKNNQQLVSNLLACPSHTLPNPSLFCSDVLRGLLIFSGSQSEFQYSKKDTKEVTERKKSPATTGETDYENMESKLLTIVKTIFV